MPAERAYIAVDLDGTLAEWHPDTWPDIGPPVPAMLERVKAWIAEGREVRILTARVAMAFNDDEAERFDFRAFKLAIEQRRLVEAWCERHIGVRLRVSAQKTFELIALYDDRAIRVEENTGRLIGAD